LSLKGSITITSLCLLLRLSIYFVFKKDISYLKKSRRKTVKGVAAFCYSPLGDGRKIAQIGQTESRRRTWVRREAKFVRSAKHFNLKIVPKRFFSIHIFTIVISLDYNTHLLLWNFYALHGLGILLQPPPVFCF